MKRLSYVGAGRALNRIIAACGHNASELARRCHVTPQAVHNWRIRGRVPLSRIPALVEAVPQAQVSPLEFLPDQLQPGRVR